MKLITRLCVNIHGTPQKVNSNNDQDQSLRYGALLLWFAGYAYLGRTINTGRLWSCRSQHTFGGSPLTSTAHTFWWTHHLGPCHLVPTHTPSLTSHYFRSYKQTLQVHCTQLVTGLVVSKYALFSFLCLLSSAAFCIAQLSPASSLNHDVMIPPTLGRKSKQLRVLPVYSLRVSHVFSHLILKTTLQVALLPPFYGWGNWGKHHSIFRLHDWHPSDSIYNSFMFPKKIWLIFS